MGEMGGESQDKIVYPELFPHINTLKQRKTLDFAKKPSVFSGRGRRLRTLGLRFWRPPLYQLSYSPVFLCIKRFTKLWWTVRDSNPGPTGYEPAALPTELTVPLRTNCRHGKPWRQPRCMAPPVGLEPTTLRLTAACSTY